MDRMSEFLPLRLSPGDDLRRTLEELVASSGAGSAFVLSGIGSLGDARLRFADEATETRLGGPFEIVSIAGSCLGGLELHVL